jgi:hypothetical protein
MPGSCGTWSSSLTTRRVQIVARMVSRWTLGRFALLLTCRCEMGVLELVRRPSVLSTRADSQGRLPLHSMFRHPPLDGHAYQQRCSLVASARLGGWLTRAVKSIDLDMWTPEQMEVRWIGMVGKQRNARLTYSRFRNGAIDAPTCTGRST